MKPKPERTYQIGFIGGGQMAQSLIQAFLEAGQARSNDILCSDIDPKRAAILEEQLSIETTGRNRAVFQQCELVFLAIKPQQFPAAVSDCSDIVRSEQVIVSIMAGVKIAQIRQVLPGRVIRVMPNTPCLVGQMAAGLAVGESVPEEDVRRVARLLGSAGLVLRVREADLDAVTGLSGSGPAFVAYLIEAFTQAGMAQGLSEEVAGALANQTFSGTARLLSQQGISPGELIQMVSSPNGTTVAGRGVLESSDVAKVISDTVARAAQRSKELSE